MRAHRNIFQGVNKMRTWRKRMRRRMVDHLRAGDEYGKGMDFFHYPKKKLHDLRSSHGSRYRGENE